MDRLDYLELWESSFLESRNMSFTEALDTLWSRENISTSNEKEEESADFNCTSTETYCSRLELSPFPSHLEDLQQLTAYEPKSSMPFLTEECLASWRGTLNSGTYCSQQVQQFTFEGEESTFPFPTDEVPGYMETAIEAETSSSSSFKSICLTGYDPGQVSTSVTVLEEGPIMMISNQNPGIPQQMPSLTEGFLGFTDFDIREGTASTRTCQSIDSTSCESREGFTNFSFLGMPVHMVTDKNNSANPQQMSFPVDGVLGCTDIDIKEGTSLSPISQPIHVTNRDSGESSASFCFLGMPVHMVTDNNNSANPQQMSFPVDGVLGCTDFKKGATSSPSCQPIEMISSDSEEDPTTLLVLGKQAVMMSGIENSGNTKRVSSLAEGVIGNTDMAVKEVKSSGSRCQFIDLTSSDSEEIPNSISDLGKSAIEVLPGNDNSGNPKQKRLRKKSKKKVGKKIRSDNGMPPPLYTLILSVKESTQVSPELFPTWYKNTLHFYTDLAEYIFRTNATSRFKKRPLDEIKEKLRGYPIPVWFSGKIYVDDGRGRSRYVYLFAEPTAEPTFRLNQHSDFALIRVGPDGTTGIQAWRVGRVHILFDLSIKARYELLFDPHIEKKNLPSSRFAYVEWYTPLDLAEENAEYYQISSMTDESECDDGDGLVLLLPKYGVVPCTDIKMRVDLRKAASRKTDRVSYLVRVSSIRAVICAG